MPATDCIRCDGTARPLDSAARLHPAPGAPFHSLLHEFRTQVPASGADHAQLPVLDQLHRDPLQRLAHRTLVEEALAEAAAGEETADLRQDPAGQVHAVHAV